MKNNRWITEYFTPDEKHCHRIKKYLVSKKTKFQKAILADTYSLGRCLILDGEMQSAENDEFIYHEALVHPALIMHPDPKKVVIMGGGEGATAREVLKHKNIEKLVTVDIDSEVVDFCKKYLISWHQGCYKNPKHDLIIADAKKYMMDTKDKFDIIISDLPNPIENGPAYMLYTKEFYDNLKNKLNSNGSLVLQAGSGSALQIQFHKILYSTLKKTFNNVAPFYAYVPSFDVPWAFLLCGDKTNPLTITSNEIDNRIKKRINGKLKFYDGVTHKGSFHTPLYIREFLKKERGIITEKNPTFFFK